MEVRVVALLQEIRHIHNLRLPINSVPDEILASIFELAAFVPVYNFPDRGDSDSGDEDDEDVN
jgi:hypothetical protein